VHRRVARTLRNKRTKLILVIRELILPKRETRIVAKSVGKSDTAAYGRARLERDAPAKPTAKELLAKVVAGPIRAHAAAVEAGFRHRRVDNDATDTERATIRK
jgi:hypothetical protein